jgi:Holliday junction resolvasome RuvABC endonuclease subunit
MSKWIGIDCGITMTTIALIAKGTAWKYKHYTDVAEVVAGHANHYLKAAELYEAVHSALWYFVPAHTCIRDYITVCIEYPMAVQQGFAPLVSVAFGVVCAAVRDVMYNLTDHNRSCYDTDKIKIYSMHPATIKKLVTGNGRATKIQICDAVYKLTGKRYKANTQHNLADANAIAIAANIKDGA